MTTPAGSTPEATPAVTAGTASAEAVVQQAQRLGLQWELRLATVITVNTDGASALCTYDDINPIPIPMISLITGVSVGQRVYVMAIPPQGNYIIGCPRSGPINSNKASIIGSTNVGTFADYPGPFTVTLPKIQANTAILVRWSPTFFVSDGATGPEFAVQITAGSISTDYVTHKMAGTLSAGVRLPSFGERSIPGLAGGGVGVAVLTITGRWRRVSGAGTVNTNADDYASLTAEEV